MEKKEAMKILKDFHDKSALFSVRTALDTVFPEFVESGDKKIRKAIYNCVKWFSFGSRFFKDVSQEECLAWIEKQGQTFTKKDIDDAYLKGICDAKKELEKRSEQKSYGLREECKDCQCNYAGECKGSCATKRNEQKPILDVEIPFGAKDSELEEVSYDIPNGYHAEIEDNKVVIKKGEKKPTEWSEEDENRINRLIAYFEDKESFTAEDDIAYANWLKSLKDRVQSQNTWKPSDEQMKCLDNVKGSDDHNGYVLNTLYNDLKKLKG